MTDLESIAQSIFNSFKGKWSRRFIKKLMAIADKKTLRLSELSVRKIIIEVNDEIERQSEHFECG